MMSDTYVDDILDGVAHDPTSTTNTLPKIVDVLKSITKVDC